MPDARSTAWSAESTTASTACAGSTGACWTRTLSARPAVYIVWIVLSLLSVPMFLMAPKELAPAEDQGIILGIVEARGGCDD